MKILISLFTVCFLAACAGKPDTSGLSVEQSRDQYKQQLKVNNPELGKKLIITDIKSRQTNNLKDVVVTLSSQYKKSQYLQYQFTWYDSEGFVIKGNHSPWQSITLFGFSNMQLPALAPTPDAVSFTLAVREVSTKAQEFED